MVHLSVRASGTFVIKKLSQKHLFHYPSSLHIASNKCRSQTTFVSNISHCAGMDGEVFTANKLGLETRGHTYPDRPLDPEILLNMISCGCKADGCGVLCGCRKTGVHCSTLCANCSGQTFNNVAPAPLLNEDDNDERSNTDDEDDD